MDWLSSSGRIDTFRYVRVTRGSWQEAEELHGITGGELERNDLTAIKSSGSLDYIEEPFLGRDLLRVWSDSFDPATGERMSIAHGTFLVSTPSSTFRGSIEEGSADLYGVLQVLAEDAFEEPLVLPAGTLAVAKAAEIVRGCGLPVVASPSTAALNQDAVFDDDDASKLDAVNWLMDFAGFASAGCDGYGNVLLRPYIDPTGRKPSLSLVDDEFCIYRSGIEREFDSFDVPNVVIATCSSAEDSGLVPAEAVNDDPMSAFSTIARGRRIVHREKVNDIADQAALQAKAEALLAEKMAVAESFEISHAFIPMEMGEVCDFVYGRAGIHRDDLVAVRQTMKLRPGMECTTHFRRFVRR